MWTVERLSPERDLEAVLEIERQSFTNPRTREMYLEEIEHSAVSHFFVLRAAGGVVGFCSVWLIFDELHINNLAVRPEWRRQRGGSELLSRVLDEGARLGARRATLEVRRSNDAARELYQRMGFEVAGARRSYYTNPVEDALILWRDDLEHPSVTPSGA